jgi:hypothetical protein
MTTDAVKFAAARAAAEKMAECDRLVKETAWALSWRGFLAAQRWTCLFLAVFNAALAAFLWSGQKSHANLWMGVFCIVAGFFCWRFHLKHKRGRL